MKSPHPDTGEPERWTARSSIATAEGAAGAALRRARDATEPRDQDVARMRPRGPDQESRTITAAWRWRLALALALLAVTGGVVGAAGVLLHRMRPPLPAPGMRPVAALSLSRDSRPRPRLTNVAGPREQPTAQSSPVAPAGTASPEQPSPLAPGEQPNSARADPPTAPLAFAPNPRVAPLRTSQASPTEARVLADAFRVLRAGQDPAAALRALDRYDRSFPHGSLTGESQIARVEALMALGRRGDALAVLSAHDTAPGEPARNILILRGELFAEAGQCENAVRDFDRLVGAAEPGDAEARALFGRAACRLRGGDVPAGQRDLRRYLERYPNGAFAPAAREALHSAP